MSGTFFILLLIYLLLFRFVIKTVAKKDKHPPKLQYIAAYNFSPDIQERFRARYPSLSDQDVALVYQGLRDFFAICLLARYETVAMPSRVVDIAWHEFILLTRDYAEFCHFAFGQFLHHTPSDIKPGKTEDDLVRAWRLSCEMNGLDYKKATVLPLLFAIDDQLGIADGKHYNVYELTSNKFECEKYRHVAKKLGNDCSGCGGGCGGGC